jgi:hypothetical protein
VNKPRFYVCGDTATFVKYGCTYFISLTLDLILSLISQHFRIKLYEFLSNYSVDPQEEFMLQKKLHEAKEDPSCFGKIVDPKTEKVVETLPGNWLCYYSNIYEVLSNKVLI